MRCIERTCESSAGAIGGRLDHTLSNLNALYTHPDLPLVLIGDGNIVRLLKAGTTCITPSQEREGQHCGIVPLQGAALVSSKGLKWDMGAPPCCSSASDGHHLHAHYNHLCPFHQLMHMYAERTDLETDAAQMLHAQNGAHWICLADAAAILPRMHTVGHSASVCNVCMSTV